MIALLTQYFSVEHIKKEMGPVTRTGEMRCSYCVLVRKHTGKRLLEDTDVDGRLTLRGIFRNWNVGE